MHNQEKTIVTNTQIEKDMNKDSLTNLDKNGLITLKTSHVLSNLVVFTETPAQAIKNQYQGMGIFQQLPQPHVYSYPGKNTLTAFKQSFNNMTQQEQTPQPKEYVKDWNSIIEFLDTAFQKVSEFNYVTGVEKLEYGEEVDKLSKDLIKEELQEHREALAQKDRVEELDAICDLIYVGLRLRYKNYYFDISRNPAINVFHLAYEEIQERVAGDAFVTDFNLFLPDFIKLSPFSLETIKQAFDEVHRSNMSKFCTTEEDALASVQIYESKGVITDYKKVGDYYIIYRFVDDKTLKGIHYSPPSLQDLV